MFAIPSFFVKLHPCYPENATICSSIGIPHPYLVSAVEHGRRADLLKTKSLFVAVNATEPMPKSKKLEVKERVRVFAGAAATEYVEAGMGSPAGNGGGAGEEGDGSFLGGIEIEWSC